MNNNFSGNFWRSRAAKRIVRGVLASCTLLAVSGIASAQDSKDEITFNLLLSCNAN